MHDGVLCCSYFYFTSNLLQPRFVTGYSLVNRSEIAFSHFNVTIYSSFWLTTQVLSVVLYLTYCYYIYISKYINSLACIFHRHKTIVLCSTDVISFYLSLCILASFSLYFIYLERLQHMKKV